VSLFIITSMIGVQLMHPTHTSHPSSDETNKRETTGAHFVIRTTARFLVSQSSIDYIRPEGTKHCSSLLPFTTPEEHCSVMHASIVGKIRGENDLTTFSKTEQGGICICCFLFLKILSKGRTSCSSSNSSVSSSQEKLK
jgi:hypothetical protein